MRSIRLAAVAAIALVLGGSSLGAQTPRLAFIRSQTILQSAPGRAEAEAQFEKEMATYRTQVQRMGDSLNAMVADFQRAQASLSPATRESRAKAISQREEEYQNRTRQLEQQAQQRQLELIRPITEQVQQVITAIRAEGNYSMIFDADAQGGQLVAADTTLDITQQVIARLKTVAAAKPATTPTTPARPTTGPSVAAPAGVSRPKPPAR